VKDRVARLGLFLALAVVVTGAIALRVLGEGERELAKSDAALAAHDLASATVHARRAAASYVPFAEHVPRAYERLRNIAADAERRGDNDDALFAWRSMRAAAIASRWLVVPYPKERREADAAVVRLSVEARESTGGANRPASAQSARRVAAALIVDEGPSRLAGVLMLGGLGCAVAGGIAITGARRVAWPGVGVSALLLAVGVVGWTVGWLLG